MKRVVSVRLKVPDNTAYTALVALRRLGIGVGRVERARIVQVEAESDEAALYDVRRDEELFNPNLHEARVVDGAPGEGEVFVRSLDSGRFATYARNEMTAWRLFGRRDEPVGREELKRACDALLCNPAIEEARFPA